MIKARDAVEILRSGARERIDCGEPVEVPEMVPGYMWAQGDVGILRIEKLPSSACVIPAPPGGQIAPGNTQGSRHCVDSDVATIYRVSDGDPLSDLCVVATEAWWLRHPEHADCKFQAGTYRILHQQNEQRQRVLD